MTLIKPYSASFYVGDNETKEFPFTFDEVSESFVKVLVSHADGSVSIPTYTVDLELKQVVFGDETPAPTDNDVVCIYRATPVIQDTPFRTLQGYNAQALENILSKIVAMIQEIKSTYFSTQVLQGDPWQLDLLKSEDDGATVNIDYVAKKLVKGLYFRINNGNLQVSADGSSYITMPKSSDIVEFRQVQTVLPDLTVQYRLQYRIGNEWFNAESNAEATADEAIQIAEEARDIASDASDKVDGFDDRLTQAEQDAGDAKNIAQDASDAVSAHITDTNNPHSVTAAQVGALPNTTKYGAALSLTINSTNYVVTAQLKDQDGNNLGTAQTIDLPLESVVVSGAYDSATKEVVLTLQDGSKIRFSVADLVSGLQTEITALNMLSADLVDDTNTTHKFVTSAEKTTWNNKQNAISDLATIRSNAQAGKAASDAIATYGNIVTHNVSEFATATQGAKADTAVQPADLATVATSGSYNDLSDTPTIPSMNNRVNGAPLSNSASVFYGVSTSAKTVVDKIVSIPSITTLDVGTAILVKPTVTSTVANSGIKLNDFPAYPMRYVGAAITTSTDSIVWAANTPSLWIFDGEYWVFAGHGVDTNTTYSAMSVAEGITGTATSSRVMTAANTKQIIQDTTLTGIDITTTGAVSDADSITSGIGKLQATKADKSEIPTVNNPTITITQGGVTKGSFTLNQATGDTIALDAGGGGIGNIDNLTITANADDEIQTVATINANTATGATNPIYDWVGTLAEYIAQNIATTHPDWLCYITDDNTAQAFDAYSKTESNARYVQQGHQVIEFQEPTAANNYTWYKKYADGWVEQGGLCSGTAENNPVTMPIEMRDTEYQVLAIADPTVSVNSWGWIAISRNTKTTTGFSLGCRHRDGSVLPVRTHWQVSGMVA